MFLFFYFFFFILAVESESPNSLEFLKVDCTNITKFFSKQQVKVMNERDLFTFITDPSIKNVDEAIETYMNKESKDDPISQNVFLQTYTPVNISHIKDPFEGKNSVEENKFLKEMLKDDVDNEEDEDN